MELIITCLIVGLAVFSLGRHFYNSFQSTNNDNCGCGGCGGNCGGCSNNNDHKSDDETRISNPAPVPKPTKMIAVAIN